MKKLLLLHKYIPTLLASVAFMPLTAVAQPAAWVTSSLVRTGVSDPAGSGTYAQIYAGRGEYESFQVVVRAPSSGLTNVNFSVSNLTGPGGAVIPSSAFTLYSEHYVYVNQSSVNWEGTNQPLGAGWYPDGLIPFTDPVTGAPIQGAQMEAVPFNLSGGTNQPLWVDVQVPYDATPGAYSGSFTVTSDQGNAYGTIGLTVWHFTLPLQPSMKSAFLYWTASSLGADEELLRNKLSPLRIDPSIQSTLMGYGLQTVGLPYFSGASNGNCDSSSIKSPPSVAELQASAAQVQPGLTPMVYSTDEISNCLNFYPVIQQWGYNLHQAGIKNLGVIPPITELFDDGSGTGRSAVDYWAVMGISYHPDMVAAAINKGDSVWSYNALVQDGFSPKWQIDFAPINFRIQPGFINQSLGLTGLLYWRVDNWSSDPWNQINDQYQFSSNNYPGEGVLVYPGNQVGIAGVAPSMRLKWLRDGVEDYEYIQMLKAAGDGQWALDLSYSIAPDWTNWTRDVNQLASVRQQLGEQLDQLYGGTPDQTTAPAQTTSTTSAPVSVTPQATSGNVAPTVTGIAPSNNGNSITFTIAVSDGNGAGDLAGATTIVNTSASGTNGCWFYYDLHSATVSLANDAGTSWYPVSQGSTGTVSNSYCNIAGTGFGAVTSGNSATVTVTVNFNPQYFAGTKTLYLAATDNEGVTSGYQNMGMWDVP